MVRVSVITVTGATSFVVYQSHGYKREIMASSTLSDVAKYGSYAKN